ncbi:MAG: lysozyme [Burkholderiaceae bacterium]
MASEQLVALVQRFEGCRLDPYFCSAGVLTCGWGATGAGVFPGQAWTQDQADSRLRSDLARFSAGVEQLCPSLTGCRQDAVISFAFNVGLGNLRASTLRKKLLAEDWDAARREFGKWVYGGGRVLPGLVRRRAAEAALFI